MTKKKKLKLSAARKKQLLAFTPFLFSGLVGLFVGIVGLQILHSVRPPSNLVWAADKTVKIPANLQRFLNGQNVCKEYRGTGTPNGVGLWGVYQISQAKFAKIAYGCSWSVEPYIMAVKQGRKWQLLQPAEYFASKFEGSDSTSGALPKCTAVDKYLIDKSIEPFCINADGTARTNIN